MEEIGEDFVGGAGKARREPLEGGANGVADVDFFMAAAKPVRAVGATTVGWSGAILDEGRESGDGVSAENGANDRRGGEAENGAPPEYFALHWATLISQRARSAAHRAHRADKAFRSVTSLLNSARWETKFLEERVMEAG